MWTRRDAGEGMDDKDNRIGSSDHRDIWSSDHLIIGLIDNSMARWLNVPMAR
jgi:hypothetical protein